MRSLRSPNTRVLSLHFKGNGVVVDSHLDYFSQKNHHYCGLNTLLINGPSVGHSRGWPTAKQIANAQEAGMQFLENTVKAEKIVLKGHSLGNGALSEAILDHDFSEANQRGIRYMVVSDRSFDKLSNAASKMIFILAGPILKILGVELNGVKAAKKPESLDIKHVVIQRGFSQNEHTEEMELLDDGVIPGDASLAYGLQRAGLHASDRLSYLLDEDISHNYDLPRPIELRLQALISNFVQETPGNRE